MSERDTYPPGVPCWVVALQPDLDAAAGFYGPLFGWEFVTAGEDAPDPFAVARLRGRDVAGLAPMPAGSPEARPAWVTHVRVEDAEAIAALVARAGGTVLQPAFDVPPAGRSAVLADPAGAVFCAWEAQAREGAQLLNEPGAWSMSALGTPDPDGANAFYGAVFGWEPEPFGPPEQQVTLWRLPGYVGGEPEQPVARDVVAVMSPLADGADPGWNLDFWVADADGTADHATRLGGRVVAAPHDTPGFRTAVLADPAGATFSISQFVGP